MLALAAGGLAITAANFGSLISSLYAFGLFLGTVYSIPPLRLKRFAVPAFMIIATVRGFLLNFGVYHAARAALQLPFQWSPPIQFITCFVTVFATVIAVTKDLPDVEGDRAHGITTFATRMGVPAVANLGALRLVGGRGPVEEEKGGAGSRRVGRLPLRSTTGTIRSNSLTHTKHTNNTATHHTNTYNNNNLGIGLLMANYAGAVFLGLRHAASFNAPLMVGAHALLAAILALRTAKLARAGYTREAVQKFYVWVWNLFYAEYVLLPFI